MFKITPALLLATTLCIGVLTSVTATAKTYKGAEIYSNETHKYGRYVLRMRMAKGSGVLSTFFTYKNGSEVSGAFWEEIDIEAFGKNDAFQWQSNIIQGQPKVTTEAVHTASQSLGDAYHTYTLDWTPNYVAWAVDGVEIRRITGGSYVTSLTNPHGMRFNIWASTAEGWVGAFNAATLPAYQFVNWMEYYTYNSNGTFTLSWRDDFTSFDTARWGKANWTFDGNYVDFDPANVVVQNGILVLALTTDTATGFTGTAPADNGAVRSSIAASSKPTASSINASSKASSKPTTSSTNTSSKPTASSTKASSKASSSVATGKNCSYLINNEWNNGFTGAIRIKNNGTATINGWNVNWSYTDGSKITNSWNAAVTGSNPYSAANLSWNGAIQPGQSVEFGFQGNKGTSATAQAPTVTGSVCN